MGTIIGEAVGGAVKGAVEPGMKEAGKTARYVIEKDPDVVIVPAKMVGYTGAGLIAVVFILMILGIILFALKFLW